MHAHARHTRRWELPTDSHHHELDATANPETWAAAPLDYGIDLAYLNAERATQNNTRLTRSSDIERRSAQDGRTGTQPAEVTKTFPRSQPW